MAKGNSMEMLFISILMMFLMCKINSQLIIENLALRQQLTAMKQYIKRPKIRTRDRIFWLFLSYLWKDWQDVLIAVKPETVIRWHKKIPYAISLKRPWRRYAPGYPPETTHTSVF
jgi:hypothetical protein